MRLSNTPGAVFLFATALATGQLEFGHVEVLPLLALLELGVFGSALTYVLFFRFIQLWGSTATSLNTYLQPIVGLTLGVLVLEENVSPRAWMALALVLAGTVIFAFRSLVSLRRPSPRVAPSEAGVLP
jgi:drug/metabolite transporter (DMT)-like permease